MTRHIILLSVLSLYLLQTSCYEKNSDSAVRDENALQLYSTQQVVVKTRLVDQGALGSSVILSICDRSTNQIVEEIGLRGEDHLPTIDSIVGKNIFIHYSFPRTGNQLKFEDVVIGDALLHKEKLKYGYVFSNNEK